MEKSGDGLGVTAVRLLSSLYIGQALGALITAITFIFVTRLLGPSNYGVYTFAFGFSAFIDAVGQFGINSYFGKELAKYTYEKDYANIMKTLFSGYAIIVPIALFFSILGIALSPYVANVLFARLQIAPLTLMLASGIIFFQTINYVTTQALVGFTKGKHAAIISLFTDIIQLFASVVLILMGYGVDGAINAMLIGYLLGASLAVYLVYKTITKMKAEKTSLPSKSDIKKAWNFAAPLGMNNVLNFALQNFLILYLGLFVSKAVLGNLGAALRGLSFIAIFYGTMSTALLPLFSTADASKKSGTEADRVYNKLLFYSLLFTLPFIVYVGTLAQPAVRLLLSSAFNGAGIYLTLIAFGTVLNTLQYYLAGVIVTRGLTKTLLKYNGFSTIIQFILLLVAAPHFGVIGAIVAVFFIGSLLDDVLLIILAKKSMGFRFEYKRLTLLFISNIILALPLSIGLLFYNGTALNSIISLAVGLLLLIIAYPAIIVIFNLIGNEDMQLIRRISKRIPVLEKPGALFVDYITFLSRLRGAENVNRT